MAEAGRDVKHILITMTVTIPLPIPESRSAILNRRTRNSRSGKLPNKGDTASHHCEIPRPSRLRQSDRMPDAPQWDGKVYRRTKFGDISIKGTAKEHEMKLQRQRFQRREAEAAITVAEIEAARFARLPWPVRAVGAVLDFVLQRS
jgi:hypothetical protein